MELKNNSEDNATQNRAPRRNTASANGKSRSKRAQLKEMILETPLTNRASKYYWKRYEISVVLKEMFNLEKKSEEDIRNRVRLLKQFSVHENIVRCYGSVKDKRNNKRYLVNEFYAAPSLTSFLESRSKSGISIEMRDKIKILVGIATGLYHIHNCKGVHENLTADNVLVDENHNVKLINYSLGDLRDGFRGQIPPEFEQTKQWNKKSDVYTFGVLALEIFQETTDPVYVRNIPSDPFDNAPDEIRSILNTTLDLDPQQRPSMAKILDIVEDYYMLHWKNERGDVVRSLTTVILKKRRRNQNQTRSNSKDGF
eukprot:TRINITY_DN7595_c0_g1_i1.p1 TRINITY_DN7595_c0_g1~~TRINITY_DN7595_c0_g1_i1.p1  ORF type:complete len:312 (-),score=62.11 TRINITY_DN7595_c0_g1_i1:745-1680(-)